MPLDKGGGTPGASSQPTAPVQKSYASPGPVDVPRWDDPSLYDVDGLLGGEFQEGYFEEQPWAPTDFTLSLDRLGLAGSEDWGDVYRPEPEYIEGNAGTLLDSFNANVSQFYEGEGANTGSMFSIAKSLLGTPYVWGGSNPAKGLDCSGFTNYVAKKMGFNLPRTAQKQYDYFKSKGWAVNPKSMKPGDYVLWYSPNSPSKRHIGIYAGNGKYYHSGSGGVKLSSVGLKVIGVGRIPPKKGDPSGLTPLPDGSVGDNQYELDPAMYDAISRLNGAMKDAGLGEFKVNSGRRREREQRRLHKQDPERYAEAGESRHHTGFAADLDMTPRQTDFLRRRGAAFGLYLPSSEPWHVEMLPGKARRAARSAQDGATLPAQRG